MRDLRNQWWYHMTAREVLWYWILAECVKKILRSMVNAVGCVLNRSGGNFVARRGTVMRNTDLAFRPQGERIQSGSEGRLVSSWSVDPERDHPCGIEV